MKKETLTDITDRRASELVGSKCESCAEANGSVTATVVLESHCPGDCFDGAEHFLCGDCADIVQAA